MILTDRPDGTLYCAECKCVFGKEFIKSKGNDFMQYHQQWHQIILSRKDNK